MKYIKAIALAMVAIVAINSMQAVSVSQAQLDEQINLTQQRLDETQTLYNQIKNFYDEGVKLNKECPVTKIFGGCGQRWADYAQKKIQAARDGFSTAKQSQLAKDAAMLKDKLTELRAQRAAAQ